jgi:anti-sigma factor RsiW
MTASQPTCRDSIELLLEYLEGELAPEIKQRLEAHLGGCSPCVDFMKSYRATPGLCRKALAREVPEEVAESLTAFLRREMSKDAK